ncbi:MAG: hypothetical protein KJZ83_12270 [Burkholderiaceae bacterium]|nr:hypothetical protein [Burkholderiaceae bacterium]
MDATKVNALAGAIAAAGLLAATTARAQSAQFINALTAAFVAPHPLRAHRSARC